MENCQLIENMLLDFIDKPVPFGDEYTYKSSRCTLDMVVREDYEDPGGLFPATCGAATIYLVIIGDISTFVSKLSSSIIDHPSALLQHVSYL